MADKKIQSISDPTEQLDEATKQAKEDFLSEMRERFEEATEYNDENYREARDDVGFIDGEDQWEPQVKQQRIDEGRPCLTVNRLPTFLDNIVGDIQKSEFSIICRPVQLAGGEPENKEEKQGQSVNGSNYTLAQIHEGIIRNIEYLSDGQGIYSKAGQDCAEHGFGYFRLSTEYVCDDVFEQDIRMLPIMDSFSVHLDPKLYTSGPEYMDYGFITEVVKDKTFNKLYPDRSSSRDFSGLPAGTLQRWSHDDGPVVAEYFRRVKTKGEIVLLSDGRVVKASELQGLQNELASAGIVERRRREAYLIEVEWYKVTPNDILKGPVKFPSKYIPIIPVLGKHTVIDGYVKLRGAIRHSKDPQRMYNYWRTAMTETVALAPKQPMIASTKQLKDKKLRQQWKNANVRNYALLLYEESEAPPPTRASSPTAPSGMAQEVILAAEDLEWTTGMFRAGVGAPSNEKSGIAIRERKDETDTQNFPFTHALAKGIQYAGKIILDMLPQVFDTERLIRIRNTDGTEDFIKINQEILDQESGEVKRINNLAAGRFDVTVDVGPSANTQRQQAVESMLQFFEILAKVQPQAAAAIIDIIAANMDWPGADQFTDRLKKLIPPELREDQGNENQQGEEGQGNITPEMLAQIVQDALQKAGIEIEQFKAQTERIEAMAKQVDALADLKEALAKINEQDQNIEQTVEAAISAVVERMAGAGMIRDPDTGQVMQ